MNLIELCIFKNYFFSLFVCSFKMEGKKGESVVSNAASEMDKAFASCGNVFQIFGFLKLLLTMRRSHTIIESFLSSFCDMVKLR